MRQQSLIFSIFRALFNVLKFISEINVKKLMSSSYKKIPLKRLTKSFKVILETI